MSQKRASLFLDFIFGSNLASKLTLSDCGEIEPSINNEEIPYHLLKADNTVDYKNELCFYQYADSSNSEYSLLYHVPFTFYDYYNKSFKTTFNNYKTEYENYILFRSLVYLMFGNGNLIDTFKIYREYSNSFLTYYHSSISMPCNDSDEYKDFYISYQGSLNLWNDVMFLESIQQIANETIGINIDTKNLNFDNFYYIAKQIRMMRY